MAAVFAIATISTGAAFANHPVLVEGESDSDGDGRIGLAENIDGDQIYGTINAALAAVAANGTVTVVTSGRFAEALNITTTTGNVTVEAAPGVVADLNAVLTGSDPRAATFTGGNAGRQQVSGIVVNAARNTRVVLRNLSSRNWTNGVLILGNSVVLIENCKFENNVSTGITVRGASAVLIDNCSVASSGIRRNSAGVSDAPSPGYGIATFGYSYVNMQNSSVVGSASSGVGRFENSRVVGDTFKILANNPDFSGF